MQVSSKRILINLSHTRLYDMVKVASIPGPPGICLLEIRTLWDYKDTPRCSGGKLMRYFSEACSVWKLTSWTTFFTNFPGAQGAFLPLEVLPHRSSHVVLVSTKVMTWGRPSLLGDKQRPREVMRGDRHPPSGQGWCWAQGVWGQGEAYTERVKWDSRKRFRKLIAALPVLPGLLTPD